MMTDFNLKSNLNGYPRSHHERLLKDYRPFRINGFKEATLEGAVRSEWNGFARNSTPKYASYANDVLAVVQNNGSFANSLTNCALFASEVTPPTGQWFEGALSAFQKKSKSALSRSSSESSSSSSSIKDKRTIPPPPKHNVMYHPSRYKTEICRQFEELGTCEYKDRCLFAHGQYELRPLPNRHPKHKTELCCSFNDTGYCSFGPRCSFVHVKPTVEDLVTRMLEMPKKLPMPENPGDVSTAPDYSGSNNEEDILLDQLEKVNLEMNELFKPNSPRLHAFIGLYPGN